jgi:hypothetical protein
MRYGRRKYDEQNVVIYARDGEWEIRSPAWQRRVRDRERYLTGFLHALGAILVWVGLVRFLNP